LLSVPPEGDGRGGNNVKFLDRSLSERATKPLEAAWNERRKRLSANA